VTDYSDLQTEAYQANMSLHKAGLAPLTWGNASAAGVFAIKPSGVAYEDLSPKRMVVVEIASGNVIAGDDRPSSDTPTHAHLYRTWRIGGVAHSHSSWATSFAQACRSIDCLGTTHADHFAGQVPITRHPSPDEIASGYELATGAIITEHFRDHGIDHTRIPAVLLPHHGPFTWGTSAHDAVKNAIVLEAVARMAIQTLALNPDASQPPERLRAKHFSRKHGPDSYYGQPS
jgi:L-ribulose-5-phosphate 4-epimerase